MLICKLIYTKGSILINIIHKNRNIATLKKDSDFILEYSDFDISNSISISLPNSQKFYISKKIIPFFETFLPEGYLFEIFKNYLTKEYGYIDDFLLFKILAANIEGRISFNVLDIYKNSKDSNFDLDFVLENDTKDTFSNLLQTFLDKNSISGVQPKSVAILRDKESLRYKNYIVKTWGDEFEYLSENEYLTLKTMELAGVKIPNIYLSKNKNFLIIERFDSQNIGFEEIISLMDKHKDKKYSGSYEQVAKEIYKFVSNPSQDMRVFFKMIVMNYMLKNGDAHLKNFALLYNDDFSNIYLSPAYDIVTTTAYIYKDKPALTLGGKKIWFSKDVLLEFGIKSCYLKQKDAVSLYNECLDALKSGIKMLKEYIENNPHFEKVGQRMLDSWELSLSQKDYKEIPNELIRDWQKN